MNQELLIKDGTLIAPGPIPVRIRSPRQNESAQAVGVVRAGDLVERYKVPHRDSRSKSGYQRPVSPTRVNKLMADLREGRVDIPTAVLLNIRDLQPGTLDVDGGGGVLDLDGNELFVVDGQHRLEALRRLVEEDPDQWAPYELNFVCMLGADELEEMKQFFVVNSTAKSVRTDLALELLQQRAENDPDFMLSLLERGEDWKVEAQRVTAKLGDTRVWRTRIRMPSDPKAATTLGSAGMVGSLKPLMDTAFFKAATTDKKVEIIEAYWEGIARVLPECFDEPTAYSLQKSSGAQVMNNLLVTVIEILRSRGDSVLEPESYARILHDALTKLEGDTVEGGVARGSDFWLSGPHGAAGGFSSNAGRRVLRARLQAELPEMEIE